MSHSPFSIGALALVLVLSACEETQPGLLEKVIFSDDEQWLDRDTIADPYEKVRGRCCNDDRPFPLPIDIAIQAEISPEGDLDFYSLRITGSFAGQLFLTSERDNMTMRLFNGALDEYEHALLDTLRVTDDISAVTSRVIWTTLYGPDTTVTILIQSDSRAGQGNYSLTWDRVIPVAYLVVTRPGGGERWARGSEYVIRWDYALRDVRPFTVFLLKGPVVIEAIRRDIDVITELRWVPDNDLEPDDDYRIMVSLTDSPSTLDISRAFAIE